MLLFIFLIITSVTKHTIKPRIVTKKIRFYKAECQETACFIWVKLDSRFCHISFPWDLDRKFAARGEETLSYKWEWRLAGSAICFHLLNNKTKKNPGDMLWECQRGTDQEKSVWGLRWYDYSSSIFPSVCVRMWCWSSIQEFLPRVVKLPTSSIPHIKR